jgi:hypothetical protein
MKIKEMFMAETKTAGHRKYSGTSFSFSIQSKKRSSE